ncbi:hypothetical protein GQ53DRAFT_881997 [Thozetella sp. PMI_491]|nr:hypothetical protein GQ53DRAFT_881997 [Thozetella sp. PMI_491]
MPTITRSAGRHRLDQRGRRHGRRTPVSTPRRSSHNQTGYGQNHDFDVSFSCVGSHERAERTSGETLKRRIATFVEDRSTFGAWEPDTAIGGPLKLPGEDLSRIRLADRRIAQWRLILTRQNGASHIQEILEEKILERLLLDETDIENTKPVSMLESTHRKAVAERLEILESGLETTVNEMQLENMRGAIAAYTSGEIPPDTVVWTIFWAGRIVDTVPDHEAALSDRWERLDRYYGLYGPGAIWFEPPLAAGGPVLMAKKGICLHNPSTRRKERFGVGFYGLRMGFRARKRCLVRDQFGSREVPHPNLTGNLPFAPTIDDNSKTVVFDMMLDTGATLPLLFSADLKALGIDARSYPAQSRNRTQMADLRTITVDMYELDATILDDQDEHLVSLTGQPKGHARSGDADALGATTLVCVLPGPPADDLTESHARLSGLVPIQVCYASHAPGSHHLWLGENRADVLGMGKMPGSAIIHDPVAGSILNSLGSDRPNWAVDDQLPPPRVIFEHRLEDGTLLRDEDLDFGRSQVAQAPAELAVVPIDPDDEGVIAKIIGPGTQEEQQRYGKFLEERMAKPSAVVASRRENLGLNENAKRPLASGRHDNEGRDTKRDVKRLVKRSRTTAWWHLLTKPLEGNSPK